MGTQPSAPVAFLTQAYASSSKGSLLHGAIGIVNFSVAIRAEQYALSCFRDRLIPASIGQRTKIELKRLRTGLRMMKHQCCEVPGISAATTPPTLGVHQLELFLSSATPLGQIGLSVVIGIQVFAGPPAVFRLSAPQSDTAHRASQLFIGHGLTMRCCIKRAQLSR